MADLIVLGFDSKATADEVFRLARDLQRQELVDLADGALAWRDENGRVRIDQAINATGRGVAAGALWGTLLGAIFLVPVVGLAAGATSGAIAGRLTDIGINDKLVKEISQTLEPGKAAVFALVRKSTPDRIRAALQQYRPIVLQTSLTTDRPEELVRALQG